MQLVSLCATMMSVGGDEVKSVVKTCGIPMLLLVGSKVWGHT